MHEVVGARRAGPLRIAAHSGLVAASAVLGALTIYARRDGVSIFEADLGLPAGLLAHLVICFIWATVFAIIAAPWRGLRVLGVAIVVSGIAWIVSPTLLPPTLQLGNDLYASLPRAAVVHSLLALGFVVGMRLAQV